LSTEGISSRYADLELWPSRDLVGALLEGQLAAAAAVAARAGEIAAAAEAAALRLADPAGRLIYAGAGTSGRIGVQDGVELEPTYSWPSERLVYALAGGMGALVASAEGAEDDAEEGAAVIRRASVGPADVVIGVAASGGTPYTVAAVREAAAAGALTIGIASNGGTPLLQAADHAIHLDTGPEVLAGSTRMKAGTAQKIALNTFSTTVMIRLGRVHKGLMVDMRMSNRKLRARGATMVAQIAGVEMQEASAALEQADGDIRRAALIARGLEPALAAEVLDAAGGDLRQALRSARLSD
jgi:N-acetylmuramic acid 6-phosphate etherase